LELLPPALPLNPTVALPGARENAVAAEGKGSAGRALHALKDRVIPVVRAKTFDLMNVEPLGTLHRLICAHTHPHLLLFRPS